MDAEFGTVDWAVIIACVMWGFGMIGIGIVIYNAIRGSGGKFD